MDTGLVAVLLVIVVALVAYPVYKWICRINADLDDCADCGEDQWETMDKNDHLF